MKKRILTIGILILMVFSVLLARLIQIQLWQTKSFSTHRVNLLEASVKQRVQEITLDNGRGNILDRYGKPLSYQQKPVLILFPFIETMDWPSKKVAQILGVNEINLLHELKGMRQPFAFGGQAPVQLNESQMQEVNNLKIPGVLAVYQKFPAVVKNQLLGSLTLNPTRIDQVNEESDKNLSYSTPVGNTGLEKTFNELLQGYGSQKLIFHTAANGLPLFGVDVKYVDNGDVGERVNLRSTIDRDFQNLAERLIEKHGIKSGGIVLVDVKTNDILAMVSKPSMNEKEVKNKGNTNQMLTPQTPGSVFKTIVAAAALEEGLALDNRLFNGDIDQLDRPISVNGRKLGMLNFEQSFAQSCNQTFGLLGRELAQKNPDLLAQYADKLTASIQVGWNGQMFHSNDFHQLDQEKKGVIFKDESMKKDLNYVANTSIGQLDVKLTPLAIASMMATIARGGDRYMARAVVRAEDEQGLTIAQFPIKKLEGDRLSPMTIMKLQQLLHSVVMSPNGTGKSLLGLNYEVAGKSGTAQVGKEANHLENKWFAGYFPFEEPKYALVAVNLSVPSNSGGVNGLYAEMVQGIYALDQSRQQ